MCQWCSHHRHRDHGVAIGLTWLFTARTPLVRFGRVEWRTVKLLLGGNGGRRLAIQCPARRLLAPTQCLARQTLDWRILDSLVQPRAIASPAPSVALCCANSCVRQFAPHAVMTCFITSVSSVLGLRPWAMLQTSSGLCPAGAAKSVRSSSGAPDVGFLVGASGVKQHAPSVTSGAGVELVRGFAPRCCSAAHVDCSGNSGEWLDTEDDAAY